MLRRALLTLFSLWFVAVLGDQGVLHSCPMRGSHAGHGSAAATLDHLSHGHAAAEHHGKAPAGGTCTCMGHCCATAAVANTPVVASLVVPAVVAHTTGFPPLVASDAPRLPDHRLPFANGPPNSPHVA